MKHHRCMPASRCLGRVGWLGQAAARPSTRLRPGSHATRARFGAVVFLWSAVMCKLADFVFPDFIFNLNPRNWFKLLKFLENNVDLRKMKTKVHLHAFE
jgi:hypothetical protein